MRITSLAVDRPIATAMVFLIIIVVGIMGFRFLPVDLLPPVEFPQLTVRTNYPNVGPEEIERIVTDRIENALAGVPNVEEMRSRSLEGESRVTLEFTQGTNVDEASNDVRAAIDRIRDDLPPEVESPRLWKFDPDNFPVVVIGAYSEMGMEEMTRILEREIAQRFEKIPGAGSVDIRGGVYREIQVRLKRDRLASSRLGASDVRAALLRENLTLPGGDMREGTRDMYVRTRGEYVSLDEIRRTIITMVDGHPIRVGDVAEVVDGYQDVARLVQIDGKPMVRMLVRKQSGANTVAVAEAARREMERLNAERDDVELMLIVDQSSFIQDSIDNVQQSAVWGGLLAVLILYLFLRNGSTTFIIALSIPISLIATFGLMFFNRFTLNQMSFGGLALGIGLIVDNAIVVLDNIVRLREQGKSLRDAALTGTGQVGGAIIASTLTTTVIFLPVVFMRTVSGMLFQELALVVVFALLCSLLVALTLVPMLSRRYLRLGRGEAVGGGGPLAGLGAALRRLEDGYAARLATLLHHRTVIFVATGLLLAGAVALWPRLAVELAPQTDADEIDVSLEMAQGTNIAVVNEYLHELETIVREALPEGQVRHLSIEIRPGDAEVEISLKGAGERSLPSAAIADHIRRETAGRIPGAEIRVRAQSGLWMLRRLFGSGEAAVQVELRGYDLDLADQVAQELKDVMATVPRVQDVRVSRREGRPEQNLVVARDKIANLGLSVSDIAEVVQTNVGGTRAGVYREGGDEFPITVRLQPEDRLSTLDLGSASVRTPSGRVVPVSAVVDAERRRGPTEIEHVDGQRVTYITANLAAGAALGDVVDDLRAALRAVPLPPDFTVLFGGEYEEQQRAQRDFTLSIIMAIVLIYMVMAAQFERFLDPVIVMLAVPLALIGVVPTLLLTGTSLNVQSLMGIVMLIGIVVNNAIVLVDYINLKRREEGLDVTTAVIESARLRLRPILMTTSTTVLGMLPLAVGGGAGGEIQAALARAVIGGLTVSTLITLLVIPAAYTGIHALRERRAETRDRTPGEVRST
ncbi:efflux RND transporter permease subunit [bacterium]|nr:efflux RND transporter permease subunit [bacterium]